MRVIVMNSLMPIYDSVVHATETVNGEAPNTTTVHDTVMGVHDTVSYFYNTLLQTLQTSVVQTVPSLFRHHLLPVTHTEAELLNTQYLSAWYLIVLAIGALVLIVYIRGLQNNLVEWMHAAFDSRKLTHILHENSHIAKQQLIPISFICLIPLTLLALHWIQPQMGYTWAGMLEYLKWIGMGVVVYFSRNGIIHLIGKTFDEEDTTSLYIASNYLFHLCYAVVGMAMAFFILYIPPVAQFLTWMLAILLTILFLVRFTRGMTIVLTMAKSPKVYFFYYLCIFEIVPIVVIAKLAISY